MFTKVRVIVEGFLAFSHNHPPRPRYHRNIRNLPHLKNDILCILLALGHPLKARGLELFS